MIQDKGQKSRYSLYVTYRSRICQKVGKFYPKRDRKRGDFFEKLAIGHIDEDQMSAVVFAIMAMEHHHISKGSRYVFVEDYRLVEMLSKANMDVSPEDIDSGSPSVFAVSWPEGSESFGIMPCLVFAGKRREFRQMKMDTFNRRQKDLGLGLEKLEPKDDDSEFMIAVSFESKKNDSKSEDGYVLASIPSSLMAEVLKSEKHMEAILPTFGLGISEKERWMEYNTVRAVLRLMIYIRACPWLVREGFPAGRPEIPRYMDAVPETVGLPQHERGSPEAHWRTWHFRPYPRKHDGTRKSGLVFVNGTVVGAKVKPETARSDVQ